jgi:hypothetical protein
MTPADALVAELMQRLAVMLAAERAEPEQRWAGGGQVSTEDLRQGLRRYRSFSERLLAGLARNPVPPPAGRRTLFANRVNTYIGHRVLRIFAITGLDRVISYGASLEDALAQSRP